MLKKTLLSVLLSISTLTITQVQLDLDVTITHQNSERHLTKTVVINENEVTPVAFEELETLVINILTQTDEQNFAIQAQFLQKLESGELVIITEPLAVQVAINQPGTIIVNEVDNSGSLILVITPSIIE